MNKYQEALNFLCDHVMEYIADFDWEENDCGEYYPLDKDVLGANKSVLQELVDKATPKKPVGFTADQASRLVCPTCKQPTINVWSQLEFRPRHCYYCGQALDWGDDRWIKPCWREMQL